MSVAPLTARRRERAVSTPLCETVIGGDTIRFNKWNYEYKTDWKCQWVHWLHENERAVWGFLYRHWCLGDIIGLVLNLSIPIRWKGYREPTTGWPRLIGCLKLQVIFRKRATKYRALLLKMTYKDKASDDCHPVLHIRLKIELHIHVRLKTNYAYKLEENNICRFTCKWGPFSKITQFKTPHSSACFEYFT